MSTDKVKTVISYLAAHGADINQTDYRGLTPLHHAALRGNEAAVSELVKMDGILIDVRGVNLL